VFALTGFLQTSEKPAAPAPPYFSGEVAFSEVMVFDYDRDGTRDKVQFWIAVEGQPAIGKPGEPGARAESGSVRYFVYDVERKKKIKDWLMGFNMGFPVAEQPYPITKISVTDRTARFDLNGTTWTITDLGDSTDQDEVVLQDPSGTRKGRFYGGVFRVVPAQPVPIGPNTECNECHRDAAVAMAASGGPHRELECATCHTEHPPDKQGARPQCRSCHEPHSPDMGDAACTGCHRGHAPATLAISATVPNAHCAACHKEQAATLRASRSLHMGVPCAVCHRSEHGATQRCQFCHRAPHPDDVMKTPEGCGSCHKTAHDLQTGRAR
jgi:hypothetical protein